MSIGFGQTPDTRDCHRLFQAAVENADLFPRLPQHGTGLAKSRRKFYG